MFLRLSFCILIYKVVDLFIPSNSLIFNLSLTFFCFVYFLIFCFIPLVFEFDVNLVHKLPLACFNVQLN